MIGKWAEGDFGDKGGPSGSLVVIDSFNLQGHLFLYYQTLAIQEAFHLIIRHLNSK